MKAPKESSTLFSKQCVLVFCMVLHIFINSVNTTEPVKETFQLCHPISRMMCKHIGLNKLEDQVFKASKQFQSDSKLLLQYDYPWVIVYDQYLGIVRYQHRKI